MVVFDVTRVSTFEAVQKWKSDIDAKVTLPPDERPIPVVLLANKVPTPASTNQSTISLSRSPLVSLVHSGGDRVLLQTTLCQSKIQCDLAKEGFCQDKAKMDAYCQEHRFIGWYREHLPRTLVYAPPLWLT